MANIPVEKTESGAAWLPWLLGLLALAAVAFFIFQAIDDPDTVETAEVEAVTPLEPAEPIDAPDATGPLTAAMFLAADDVSQYVGENVTFTGLRVMEVTGDKTFTVSPDGSDQTMLVYLEEEMTPGVQGVEGRYDVNPGQMVELVGTVQMLTADEASAWDVGSSGATGGSPYVRATALDIDGAELDQVEVDDTTIE
ncbi:hypothetical protein [Rubricoccus marinus]|uniref:Uncharacterized protein n=1 Tax=Rubricoccus marinus TaxID=716817 RepID=A0A259TW35_9BACT|nr:hypothetical protein [Rubricoccus marinus]OZC01979.1 hypothetical protein BSZ36_02675 [Rubricoccus marinus]